MPALSGQDVKKMEQELIKANQEIAKAMEDRNKAGVPVKKDPNYTPRDIKSIKVAMAPGDSGNTGSLAESALVAGSGYGNMLMPNMRMPNFKDIMRKAQQDVLRDVQNTRENVSEDQYPEELPLRRKPSRVVQSSNVDGEQITEE